MKKQLLPRPMYIDFLLKWRNEDLIKVVTGVRRCGKSTLFELYKNHLIESGISKTEIISINFEDFSFFELREPQKLHNFVKKKTTKETKYYVFLDEIQVVENFENVVNSLYLDKNIDLYITGSNAYLLSGELATYLSGRYVELRMLPLSFKEYSYSMYDSDLRKTYQNYLSTSFPFAIHLDDERKRQYLDGIYSTVVLKDVVQRLKVADVDILERLIRYIFSEIGSLQNTNKITNTMVSLGNKITFKTVSNYIRGVEDALLIYKAERYNVKGKKVLGGNVKYYVADIGLRRLIANDRAEDFGHILENIVYLELLRRGYKVYVGVVDNEEVDFLAIKSNERIYIQVALNTENEQTLKRELASLQKINDNYPKLLLTMDDILTEQNFDGIVKTNVLSWLIDS